MNLEKLGIKETWVLLAFLGLRESKEPKETRVQRGQKATVDNQATWDLLGPQALVGWMGTGVFQVSLVHRVFLGKKQVRRESGKFATP